MKVLMNSILLILLTIASGYPQSMETESITVNIRRVSKSQTNKASGIEIELTSPKGFYVGGLYWCLQIGKLSGVAEGGIPHHTADGKPFFRLANTSGNTILFGFTKDDWKKMKNGDPMRLTWGCPKSSNYEEIKPFAFLNKKLPKKENRVK